MQLLLSQKRKLIASLKKKDLGTSSPQSLLNTVWLSINSLRGCTEQRNLRWGDVVLETDSQGKDMYFHSERQTKNRQDDNSRNVKIKKLKLKLNFNATYVLLFSSTSEPVIKLEMM